MEMNHIYTRAFRVYGADGHRQKESFNPTRSYNWTTPDKVRVINIINADTSGTNEYSTICITAESDYEIYRELAGQIDDGIFENYRVGKITEIIDGQEIVISPWEKANDAREKKYYVLNDLDGYGSEFPVCVDEAEKNRLNNGHAMITLGTLPQARKLTNTEYTNRKGITYSPQPLHNALQGARRLGGYSYLRQSQIKPYGAVRGIEE